MSFIYALRSYDFKNLDWRLLVVRTYTLVRTLFDTLSKQTVKSSRFLLKSFSDETYYFIDGSYIPVSEANLANYKGSLGVATVNFSYKYVRDTNTIYSLPSSTEVKQMHTTNILDAKLMLGDRQLYDMTDFFDTVEFVSTRDGDFPPLLAWLSFFSVETGVILDSKADLKLRISTLDGANQVFTVWSPNAEELGTWKAINTPMTLHRQPEVAFTRGNDSGDEYDGRSNAGSLAPAPTPVAELEEVDSPAQLPAPSENLQRQETTLLASPSSSEQPPEN